MILLKRLRQIKVVQRSAFVTALLHVRKVRRRSARKGTDHYMLSFGRYFTLIVIVTCVQSSTCTCATGGWIRTTKMFPHQHGAIDALLSPSSIGGSSKVYLTGCASRGSAGGRRAHFPHQLQIFSFFLRLDIKHSLSSRSVKSRVS